MFDSLDWHLGSIMPGTPSRMATIQWDVRKWLIKFKQYINKFKSNFYLIISEAHQYDV